MEKRCFGVDIGGTTVKMGLFTVDGKVTDKWEIPTRKEENGKYILEDIAKSVKERKRYINIRRYCRTWYWCSGTGQRRWNRIKMRKFRMGRF